jgi:hypothetical protein
MGALLCGMKQGQTFLGLLRYRQCPFPTWRGWCLLLLVTTLTLIGLVRSLYSFLAVRDPAPGGLLVVEGWAPDYTLESAFAEFRGNRYEGIFVTGGPLDKGAPFSEFKTYAELGAALIAKMGAQPELLHAVPAPPVRKDRTYVSALALKDWLREHKIESLPINVVSVGPHSRRTRMLFQKALGPDWRIGILPVEDQNYDPQRWWASSHGFRAMTGETIAYVYALLFTGS